MKLLQIHKSQKNNDFSQKVHDGELYKAYVEMEYEKKKHERELWKNKYIRKGRYNSSDYEDKMAYSSYLDKQVAEK